MQIIYLVLHKTTPINTVFQNLKDANDCVNQALAELIKHYTLNTNIQTMHGCTQRDFKFLDNVKD